MNLSMNMVAVAGVAAASGAVAGGIAAAGFVNLQDASPGAAQNGHINVDGNVLAGKFGSGVQPTLARVQVKEAGTLQGVRSESNSGVAVFGKSTATTGLGAGGYFTTSSAGGRGIVGDALNGAGNTVGGLFYNRSAGGGVGVWGRAIGAGGTATGVFGETVSSNGTALRALNGASGHAMSAGTGTDSLQTSGALPRHVYGATTAAMVPIAYGVVFSDGTVANAGSGNWTSSRTAVGRYTIAVPGSTLGQPTSIIVCTAVGVGDGEIISVNSGASGTWAVGAVNHTGADQDTNFHFVIFKPTGIGAMPASLQDPPGSDERRTPELDRRRAAARAHQERILRTRPEQHPVDELGRP